MLKKVFEINGEGVDYLIEWCWYFVGSVVFLEGGDDFLCDLIGKWWYVIE